MAGMSEQALIDATPEPRTRESLAADLRSLGVGEGMTLLVHSSLSAVGWVSGGPVAVIQALLDVLGPSGTLVMPAHTGGNTDPGEWQHPPVPKPWQQVIRDSTPGFDPRITPTRGMGAVPELFRTWPGAIRSNHPVVSFAALGSNAEVITADHELDRSLGERSPLARLYDLGASVLLLGAGYDSNTSFHLAEYRSGKPEDVTTGTAILRDGERLWTTFTDVDLDSESFPEIGEAFERTGAATVGKIGSAESKLYLQPTGVDFAVDWMLARSR
jgi:aminoglycoside 3-N-acetyltransferase